jgi:Na+/H+-dicarboxylate symporter
MIMVALVVSSIITGLAGNTGAQLKQIGGKSLLYFIFTTVVSVCIGAFLSIIIHPGTYIQSGFDIEAYDRIQKNASDPAMHPVDFLLNLIPDNPLRSILFGEMLSIVVFSLLIGVAVSNLKAELSEPLLKLMSSIQQICMNIVNWAMLLVPYAVFGIMASLVATAGRDSFNGLGLYSITVLLGLTLILSMYFVLILIVGKRNPFLFFSQIKDAVLLAFSTTSSAAVMPVSLKIAEENLNIRESISRFIIPLGTTINMDGTALYQCVSFIFITQIYGIELLAPELGLSLFTIIAASIGTPGVPGAGVIVLAGVLQGAGIPAEGIITIMGMERILGMFRSAVNVTGDLTACIVFDKWIKK